jgi:hypothetical protein
MSTHSNHALSLIPLPFGMQGQPSTTTTGQSSTLPLGHAGVTNFLYFRDWQSSNLQCCRRKFSAPNRRSPKFAIPRESFPCSGRRRQFPEITDAFRTPPSTLSLEPALSKPRFRFPLIVSHQFVPFLTRGSLSAVPTALKPTMARSHLVWFRRSVSTGFR